MKILPYISLTLAGLLAFSAQASTQKTANEKLVTESFYTESEHRCDSESCRDKFKKVFRYARYGNPGAQVLVATAFLTGDGLEQDVKQGAKWLKKAVRQGSTKALWMLSNLYRDGIGVEQDLEKAEHLLQRAIKRSYGPAMFQKAAQTFDLAGDTNSNKEEIELIKLADKAGYKPASYLLAKMYETGSHIEQDLYSSAKLYRDLQYFDYRDSNKRLESIAELAKTRSDEVYQKITALNDDTEVITVTYNKFDYEASIDNALKLFKDERSIYDGKTTGSRIPGNNCATTGTCNIIDPEDFRIMMRRR